MRVLRRSELLDLWYEVYKTPAPRGIRREILVPFLAYRIQENAYGSLDPAALKELHCIARALAKNLTSSDQLARTRIKIGTRLFRKWHGQTHEVSVTEAGYGYRGAGYRSLSEIARKITGTRWSGPAFFGLKKSTSVPGHRDA